MASTKAPDPQLSADPAQLKSPLQLGVTGLRQLLQCYQVATEDVRTTLLHECDVIVECRVCRSLYRGLPNFLAHKSKYCPNRFAGTLVRFQGMTTKEDETVILGSGVAPRHDVGAGPPKKPSSTEHRIATNLENINSNMAAVRSTDAVVKLDTLDLTKNAVSQTLLLTYINGGSNSASKKRKAEEAISPDQPAKAAKTQPVDNLNGVLVRSGTDKASSLRIFYQRVKLVDGKDNACLKCNMSFTSYKTLKLHMKRRHVKVRSFHQCHRCRQLYITNQAFLRHLLQDHKMSQSDAVGELSRRRVEKYVVDTDGVYDIPNVVNAQHGETSQVKEEPQESAEESAEEEAQSEEEEEDPTAGSDTPGSPGKRGGYLCPKSFWLTIMRCLGLFIKAAPPKRYQCAKHLQARFQKYTSYKEHVINEHLKPIIVCPKCPATFKKYGKVAKLGRHMKMAHGINENSVWSLKKILRRNMLIEGEQDETEPQRKEPVEEFFPEQKEEVEEAEEEEEEPEKLTPQEPGPARQEVQPSAPRGVMEYYCPECRKSFTSNQRAWSHMKVNHNTPPEQYEYFRAKIEETIHFRAFKMSSRQQPRELESGTLSTFSLEDYYCPRCPRMFPKMHQVISHLMANHGFSRDEAKTQKERIRKDFNKRKEQNLLNLTSTRTVRSRTAPQDQSEEDEPEESDGGNRNKRKGSRPAKSEDNTENPIIFKSGFSLHHCKCKKIFGNEAALKAHVANCPAKSGSDSSSDEEQDVETNSAPAAGPSCNPDQHKQRCQHCQRGFARKASRIVHERWCQHRPEDNAARSGADDTDRKKDNMYKVYKCPNSESDSSSDEEQDVKTNSSPAAKPSRNPFPHKQRCRNCQREFARKASRIVHERWCQHQPEDNAARSGANSNDNTVRKKDSMVMYKVYKCPLCDIEDLELHKISTHLMAIHSWTSDKVAARRDTLKRSVVFKSCQPAKPAGSPSKSSSPGGSASLTYSCPRCPKTFSELWQLTYHCQMIHQMQSGEIADIKRNRQEGRKQERRRSGPASAGNTPP